MRGVRLLDPYVDARRSVAQFIGDLAEEHHLDPIAVLRALLFTSEQQLSRALRHNFRRLVSLCGLWDGDILTVCDLVRV
ncbi:hypothetical protein ACQP2U_37890 [Nocardia sp. CA-084685]|uniref:hypothetical protein n=1 Tax=Nocardia sp. CA-084685 TaxID=3239970 RepID=UPI003D968BB0